MDAPKGFSGGNNGMRNLGRVSRAAIMALGTTMGPMVDITVALLYDRGNGKWWC